MAPEPEAPPPPAGAGTGSGAGPSGRRAGTRQPDRRADTRQPDRRAGTRPAFDTHHPPRAQLLSECVHCGFCLPSCPTYALWGVEMDSPRGRIHLMAQGLAGEPLTGSMVRHFDRCLGCMACVTACPSGVRYDRLIADTRQQVERRHPRPARERALRGLLFRLAPYPRRLRPLRTLLRWYQLSGARRLLGRPRLRRRLGPTASTLESLVPRLVRARRLPGRIAAHGPRRAVVGLLTGCVQRVFFPEVNAATARVLAAEGCEVVIPAGQGCCGALSVHNGREAEAQRFARALIDTFERCGVDYVVANAAGCGSTLKEYADLLRDDPAYAQRAARFERRARDLAELLDELGPVAPRHPLPVVAAYHDACHLGHAQGVREQPRRLLGGVPGLALREIAEPELCCGSAGVWNLLNPVPAAQLGERKARGVLDTGARLLVTANPGCLMQLAAALRRAGGEVALVHTAQLLDASIRGIPVERLLASADGPGSGPDPVGPGPDSGSGPAGTADPETAGPGSGPARPRTGSATPPPPPPD